MYLSDVERINFILGVLHLNPPKFSEALGLNRVDSVYNILKGRNGISKKMATLIVSKFPMISLNWLLTGEGEPIMSYSSPADRIRSLMYSHKLEPIGLALKAGLNFSGEILDVISKGVEPSKELLAALVENFPDQKKMLTDGLEEMEPVEIVPQGVMLVPLVSQYATAGYLNGWADEIYVEHLPKVPFLVESNPKGVYRCFEVRGDSMDDGSINSYPDGSIVLCREVQKTHWTSKLHINDWDFIIVHREEGILLKRIVRHDLGTGILTLHSINTMYDDFDVNIQDVVQILNVVRMIRSTKR